MDRISAPDSVVEDRARDTGVQPGTRVTTVRGRPEPELAADWRPQRIGPRFSWLNHETIRIEDGGLAGREFGLVTDLRRNIARLSLLEGNVQAGEVSIERDPPGRGVVLWDIGVREELRGNGLAAVMTWCSFRELLLVQDTATFRIRMIRSLKPGEGGVEIQNVGICVVAARLGFEPEIDLNKIIGPRKITGIDIIPKRKGLPPALKIAVKSAPWVLIAFVLEPRTMRPVAEDQSYLSLIDDEDALRDWAHLGRLVITNGNYCLRRHNLQRFADIMATDPEEAWRFRVKMRGL